MGCIDWAVGANEDADPFVVLYLGRNDSIASDARAADEHADDVSFGRLLGYPSCCTEWVRSRGSVPALSESFALYAADGQYKFLAWPASMSVDAPLLPHFPCCRGCLPSRNIALGRLRYLLKTRPSEITGRIEWASRQAYHLLETGEIRTGIPLEQGPRVIASAHPDGADLRFMGMPCG
jgi:hypothetical protein